MFPQGTNSEFFTMVSSMLMDLLMDRRSPLTASNLRGSFRIQRKVSKLSCGEADRSTGVRGWYLFTRSEYATSEPGRHSIMVQLPFGLTIASGIVYNTVIPQRDNLSFPWTPLREDGGVISIVNIEGWPETLVGVLLPAQRSLSRRPLREDSAALPSARITSQRQDRNEPVSLTSA